MTRSSAREIAIHLIYELSFGLEKAEDVLERELNCERFQQLEGESELYRQYPNEKQEQYIRQLVKGAFDHGAELDDYIARYAHGWAFARIPRMAAAIMRTWAVLAYLPYLALSGVITGLFTGLCTQFLMARLEKLH